MTRALVTGATGFIGPHLVRALRGQGVEVTCLRRAASNVLPLEPLDVRFKVGDVTCPETLPAAIEGAEIVFHLAGLTRALSRRELLAVNVEGTRNLLAACAAQANPPIMVLVSSLAAAGPSLGDRPRSEDETPAPVSNYGRSKRAAELVAHKFADRVPITIVRPPLVFGQGDASVLTIFRPIQRFGVHLVPGFAERRFSVIHAADLATALVAAASCGQRILPAESPAAQRSHTLHVHAQSVPPSPRPASYLLPSAAHLRQPGYYFVAGGEHPTYAELGCRISLALGRGALVLRIPEWLTWATAGVSEIIARMRRRPHAFNGDKAREAVAGSWTCSPERAQRELGWACAGDLDQRLRETVDWYRAHGWL